jgi:hypothetical protein
MLDEADALAHEMISDDFWREIVRMIPDDWLHWNGSSESPDEIRDMYFAFLKTRFAYSSNFVNVAKNAANDLNIFQYAVIRFVPNVEREEFVNVGLIMYSKKARYIRMEYRFVPKNTNRFVYQVRNTMK